MASRLEDVIQRGTRTNQPLATTVPVGTLYFVSNEGILERSNGSTWDSYSSSSGSSSSVIQGPPGLDGISGESFVIPIQAPNPVIFDLTLASNTINIDTGANGIPPGFNVFEAYILARSNEAIVGATLNITVNNDGSAIYDKQFIRGDDTTVSVATGSAAVNWPFVIAGASCTAGVFSVIQLSMPFYSQTVAEKSGIAFHTRIDQTPANRRMEMQGILWRNTVAINRLAISASVGNLLLAGSRLLIFGR